MRMLSIVAVAFSLLYSVCSSAELVSRERDDHFLVSAVKTAEKVRQAIEDETVCHETKGELINAASVLLNARWWLEMKESFPNEKFPPISDEQHFSINVNLNHLGSIDYLCSINIQSFK